MADSSLSHFRREYLSGDLSEKDLLEDPYLQFMVWMEDAVRSGIDDPNAMALATADADGKPSVRIVLLKEARPDGLIFLTNYNSRKGRDMEVNHHAAAMFYWPGLERQLRVEGSVEMLDPAESDDLFNARPPESRIAAIISGQSRVIPDRAAIEDKFREFRNDHADNEIIRPPYWGGYILRPSSYEFWQGRENRLHDRLRYLPDGKHWKIERLAP